MEKNDVKRILIALLLVLLCVAMLAACKPDTPDIPDEPDQPDDPGKQDEPDEPGKPDEPAKKEPWYVYPEGEYDAMVELFGKWEENFAPGERTLAGLTTYSLRDDGLYIQTRPAIEIVGPRTYASVDRPYSPAMHVNVDAYVCDSEYARSYKKAGYELIGHDGSFNKSGYAEAHPDVYQVNADGSRDGLWDSSVLTQSVINHSCKTRLSADVKTGTWYIGFCEPEMFRAGVYGAAYKGLWKMKYGEEWWDPTEDVLGTMMAQRLNVWTHTNAIRAYVSYLCSKDVDFKNFSIAPHSTLAYTKLGVTDGFVHMMGTGLVKTVTGQTWSNTIENLIRYAGTSVKDPFINGLLDYGTYIDATDYYGADFYALCDPMSDTAASVGTEEYWRGLCHDQLVSSMMYPEINRWQLIWTNRSFMNVSPDYRSEQLNIHNALLDISGKEFKLTAGTPGITYLLSDTLAWQDPDKTAWSDNAYDGFWGVAAPLLYDGIPLRTRAMELVSTAKDLEGVSLLIVSYDNQKPLYEEVNEGIAEWVKAGGTLLYLGGSDAYESVYGAFWNEDGKGGSPVGNLLLYLGLDGVKTEVVSGAATLAWAASDGQPDGWNGGKMRVGTDEFTYMYSGTGFEPVLRTSAGDVVGMRAEVGKGSVVMVGLSTADYGDSADGAALLRALTAYALNDTEYEYVTADAFMAERGDYVAIYPLKEDVRLEGTFLNIFSSDLQILVDPVIGKQTSALLRRVDLDVDKPTVLSMGGIADEVTESAEQTVVKVHAAENALIPIRIAAPAGRYPVSVTATYGGNISNAAVKWDDATGSLLVNVYSTPTAPVTVTVTWGDQKAALFESHYESFSIKVCQDGEDEAYIVSNTGNANGSSRYCDLAGQIVWKFDIAEYDGLQLAISLQSNYIVEISGDGETWTKVVDYSELSTTRATASNNSVTNVPVNAYPDVTDTVYIRLRNTDPTGGWGGAITAFTFQYLVED